MSGSEQPLRIVFVGHVDHGKSTLVGRLFHDTGSLPEGKLDQIKGVCQRRGVPFEWAFLMDALQAERDQNITIDTSQIWFRTEARPYVIIDAPGHREFLKNMITGAASADAAFLLIAANEGVQEQSRRHGYMLSLLGIKQVVVLVNKMDLVDYDEETYDQIEAEYRDFLGQIGLEPRLFIPVSAREGDNVAEVASETMPWWEGPSVVEALDQFHMPRFSEEQPLRFPVQDVYRFDERRIIAGRLESGSLKVGDELLFEPYNKRGVVKTIERWSAPAQDRAVAGESVGVTLTEQIFVERGHVGSLASEPPGVTNRFRANLFWMGRQQLELNKRYKLKLATQEIDCRVVEFERVIDASTLDVVQRESTLERDDVAEVVIETKYPVAIDEHHRLEPTGRFVLVDGFDLSGGGIVTGTLEAVEKKEEGHVWRPVRAQERYNRNGHKGLVVWLEGLNAERSAFASALDRSLFNRGVHTFLVDRDLLSSSTDVGCVVASMAVAGLAVVVDIEGNEPVSEVRERLDGFDAEVVTVSLTGSNGDARIAVDLGRGNFDADVEMLTEELLPMLRQTWTVEPTNI